MDTLGLLAAWIGVVSFLFGIFVAIVLTLVGPALKIRWARTSRVRAERRLSELMASSNETEGSGTSFQVQNLIHLYGIFTITLVAALGFLILSTELLDFGPQLLATMLPFNIDSKLLTRSSGLLTCALSYLFIFRLAYLSKLLFAARTFPMRTAKTLQEVSELRERLNRPS